MCKSTTEGGKRCEGHLRSDYMSAMDPMDTKIGTAKQYAQVKLKATGYAMHPKGITAINRDILRYEALCLESIRFPDDYAHYSYVISILRGALRDAPRASAINQDIANVVKQETSKKKAVGIGNVYSLQDYRDQKQV